MDSKVRADTLKLLKEAVAAVRSNDSYRLKQLSRANVQAASIFQDADILSISVAIYALSKVIERSENKSAIAAQLKRAINSLSLEDYADFRAAIRELIRAIEIADYRLKRFASSVIEQAEIKKGCALCENGISIARASDILGISQWDLMRYFGRTKIAEQSAESVPTERRLAVARSVFR
ncbi:hypothetical protein HYX10_01110 [Candidatus Woesearchaeota archaeon]|nr:hypothetical protein [Candidatus Woesearchaeota archaeon]